MDSRIPNITRARGDSTSRIGIKTISSSYSGIGIDHNENSGIGIGIGLGE